MPDSADKNVATHYSNWANLEQILFSIFYRYNNYLLETDMIKHYCWKTNNVVRLLKRIESRWTQFVIEEYFVNDDGYKIISRENYQSKSLEWFTNSILKDFDIFILNNSNNIHCNLFQDNYYKLTSKALDSKIRQEEEPNLNFFE